ncbi:MAG: enoyl-CoA hydratase/isomerase family protein [Syntrophales bacterium]|jgi:enoyl-CoA hydratase/carnithine racemase|nr:enoyl-CoA hydratase/isomerase family protein [Syntrophales bacterium]MDY0044494.1 enoyl-CoA hydratase/isomerase family protein [Syntrophales bacterium]
MQISYSMIHLEKEDNFCVVTLDRPKEMNALCQQMQVELIDCFDLMEQDESIRAVVLTGGEYVFSAGIDLKELSDLSGSTLDDYIKSMIKYLQKIYAFRKPVVAAVSGIALGGGFNLATVCDLIIASETAIFGHPELKFGLNPLFDSLRRIVGTAKAKELTMLGEPIGAKEALRIGLVNKVLPPESFMEGAKSVARELASRPAKAIEAVKRLSDIVPRLDKNTALEYEFEITALLFSRSERRDFMEKFLEELRLRKEKSRS